MDKRIFATQEGSTFCRLSVMAISCWKFKEKTFCLFLSLSNTLCIYIYYIYSCQIYIWYRENPVIITYLYLQLLFITGTISHKKICAELRIKWKYLISAIQTPLLRLGFSWFLVTLWPLFRPTAKLYRIAICKNTQSSMCNFDKNLGVALGLKRLNTTILAMHVQLGYTFILPQNTNVCYPTTLDATVTSSYYTLLSPTLKPIQYLVNCHDKGFL